MLFFNEPQNEALHNITDEIKGKSCTYTETQNVKMIKILILENFEVKMW